MGSMEELGRNVCSMRKPRFVAVVAGLHTTWRYSSRRRSTRAVRGYVQITSVGARDLKTMQCTQDTCVGLNAHVVHTTKASVLENLVRPFSVHPSEAALSVVVARATVFQ